MRFIDIEKENQIYQCNGQKSRGIGILNETWALLCICCKPVTVCVVILTFLVISTIGETGKEGYTRTMCKTTYTYCSTLTFFQRLNLVEGLYITIYSHPQGLVEKSVRQEQTQTLCQYLYSFARCSHDHFDSQRSDGELPSLSFTFVSAFFFTRYSAMPSLSHTAA